MKKLLFLSIALLCVTSNTKNIITIGSPAYGAWAIPEDLLDKNSVCYLVGAGENITFDFDIVKKYGCHVYTIDPTPRSQEHINYIKKQTALGLPAYSNPRGEEYNLTLSDLELLSFIPVGLWHTNETLKFYVPRNPKHVSLSIGNLHNTQDYFELPCKRLSTIMQELGHSHITLLKLDIEGAECSVLDTIFEDNIDIKCLCIEWDEMAHAKGKDRAAMKQKVEQYIKKLNSFGYVLVCKQDHYNMTFFKPIADTVISTDI